MRRSVTDAPEQQRALAQNLVLWWKARARDAAATSDSLIVASYAPFRRELDPAPLLDALAGSGTSLVPVYPRTLENRLEFAQPLGGWTTSSFGVDEPRGPAVDPRSIDLVLVPALALDCTGTRLGYGGGYYDRFLLSIGNAAIVAAVFREQLSLDRLPAEPHDVTIPTIATADGVTEVELE